MRQGLYLILTLTIICAACKKEEQIVFTDNDVPPYSEIPTIRVQNYVNRLYIDCLGREPLDLEMNVDVAYLEENGLNLESREFLLDKIMFDQNWIAGDSSYNYAYFFKVYEDTKARLLEGSSDGFVQEEYNLYYSQALADSINGNYLDYQRNLAEADKLAGVMDSREQYRLNEIGINEMYSRMMNNSIYDAINMNTFNFVNASFDDLYYRFPTTAELDNAYLIIENNAPATIFGQVASNKIEYLNILTTTDEYEEGIINWAFLSLLAREPSSSEVFELIQDFSLSYDLQTIQKEIMKTDEYAGFD